MEVEQEEAHRGWKRRDDMAEDLRSWFCKLSTQERLQVSEGCHVCGVGTFGKGMGPTGSVNQETKKGRVVFRGTCTSHPPLLKP